MQHVIRFVHRAADGFQVVDAALDERNLVANFSEIFFLAGREIVEHHDAFPAAHQFIHGIGTDKACAAGDHVSHSCNPLATNSKWPNDTSHELPQDARKCFWYPENSGSLSTDPETRKKRGRKHGF